MTPNFITLLPLHCNILQDIDQISTLDEHSLMSFNFDKCHVMTLGELDGLYNYTMKKFDYPLLLNRCNEEQDLGILLTPNLKCSQHINQIACKSIIRIIKQSFSCLDKIMFCTLYASLVCPHLEYGSEI